MVTPITFRKEVNIQSTFDALEYLSHHPLTEDVFNINQVDSVDISIGYRSSILEGKVEILYKEKQPGSVWIDKMIIPIIRNVSKYGVGFMTPCIIDSDKEIKEGECSIFTLFGHTLEAIRQGGNDIEPRANLHSDGWEISIKFYHPYRGTNKLTLHYLAHIADVDIYSSI
jgi:hypothetical protein